MSKIEQAKKIVAANSLATRSELISLFMSQLNMSKAGATTYFYNATKGSDRPTVAKKSKAVPAKKASKAPSSVKKIDSVLRQAARVELDRINAEMDEFEKTHKLHQNGLTLVKLTDEEIKVKNLETMKKVSAKRAAQGA